MAAGEITEIPKRFLLSGATPRVSDVEADA
jgi:hypothetical protein